MSCEKFSCCLTERGSAGKLECLGNKVHVAANRKRFSRGRTAFLQTLPSELSYFSTGKVPCWLQKRCFF